MVHLQEPELHADAVVGRQICERLLDVRPSAEDAVPAQVGALRKDGTRAAIELVLCT